ncbi:protein-tyrosine phosphatase-like protein [Dichomitus squalens]|uniref:Protein-tyrosine phosphatase-like protein n=1 Tax=Dichomitus squalens TaxID=114155 RepID=A0A4Q9MYC8_9APHY|nr:protein-tyrosine phosphatase-like protein [Dichomitus squalens]
MDLEPLDPADVSDQLSKPPFVSIPGVVNVRDLGSYPTDQPGFMTRPRMVYRSGEISFITPEGITELRDILGISKVYDLRSDTEMQKYGTPIPEMEGVEVIHVPVFKREDYSPEAMARRFELYASGKTEAFMQLYSQILDHAGPAFGVVLRHIRDKPEQGCLFHCTAGKDRTGVLAALLLKLAGVDDENIARDYALTRVGREPAREMVMRRLALVPFFASNTEGALSMLSSRHETMIAFLRMLHDRYGGAEAYVQNVVGLSADDIATIKRNFLAPVSRS